MLECCPGESQPNSNIAKHNFALNIVFNISPFDITKYNTRYETSIYDRLSNSLMTIITLS